MGKLTDVLLGCSEKQRARIDKAKADAARQRQELRERIAQDKADTATEWRDVKARARAQSRGETAD